MLLTCALNDVTDSPCQHPPCWLALIIGLLWLSWWHELLTCACSHPLYIHTYIASYLAYLVIVFSKIWSSLTKIWPVLPWWHLRYTTFGSNHSHPLVFKHNTSKLYHEAAETLLWTIRATVTNITTVPYYCYFGQGRVLTWVVFSPW